MAHTLHWQSTSTPAEQTSSHADYAAGEAAERAKALGFFVAGEAWFKLWLDDGTIILHMTEKSGA